MSRWSCLLALALSLPAAAAPVKTPAPTPVASGARISCPFNAVAIDWDFSTGTQGFMTDACVSVTPPVWEYGATAIVPGAPARVWGTILNANYNNSAGMALQSPWFPINASTCFMQILHFVDVESPYDGGNVSILGSEEWIILHPIDGYPVSVINQDPNYYAYCVEGQPGWSGPDAGWRVDCFDLRPYMGGYNVLRLTFGSDESVTRRGWYIASIRLGSVANPVAACCRVQTGACAMTTESECQSYGVWHPEWTSCEPNPCAIPLPNAELELGPWIDPEPWHDWFAAMPGAVQPVRACTGGVPGQIQRVVFYYSRDNGVTWQGFDTDSDGSEPSLSTYGSGVIARGDGWTGYLQMPSGLPGGPVRLKAIIQTDQGEYQAEETAEADPLPPSLGTASLQEWTVTDVDALGTDVHPNGCDLDRIIVYRSGKVTDFHQGVPAINQHIVSDKHCAPTATAQTLKYWESTGDTQVTGGLSNLGLVNGLAGVMYTSTVSGTKVSNWVCGTDTWISQHGNGYTVREQLHFTESGSLTWSAADWRRMRYELERGASVLNAVFWQTGGGHTMTLDAILNTLLPNGRVALGFKDPWTGTTSTAQLDPTTGLLYQVSGSGGGGVGYLGTTILVTHREATVSSGGPGSPIFDGLPSGPPYHLVIPLPSLGSWFVHFVLVNQAGHAYRLTRIVTRVAPGAIPEGEGPVLLANRLLSCRPNPFGTESAISYMTDAYGPLRIDVFDVQGRLVRTLAECGTEPGVYETSWDGRDGSGRAMPAGVYYVKLRIGTFEDEETLTLAR